MKVMISIPMNGIDDNIVKNQISDIKKDFAKLHIDCVDSFLTEEPINVNHEGVYYLSRSLDILSQCDAMFFHKDWQKARGCRIERQICKEYGIKILDWEWLYPNDIITRIADSIDRSINSTISSNPSIMLCNNEQHVPHID